MSRLAPVLKSQFHSGSSTALTRSAWQQEFVSPPNLEITFSAAGHNPPSLSSLRSPFSLSASLPSTLAAWRSTAR